MKKITTLLAFAALVAGAASCNKAETETPSPVQVNISVSELTPATKAIKSAWADGDIINIYLDDATSSYVPDFQLSYSGGSWAASPISAAVAARLKTSGGTLKGFWEATNSAIDGSGWGTRSGSVIRYDRSKEKSSGIPQDLVALFNNITYSYDGSTVSASIDAWEFKANIQLVVTGLPAGTYALYCDQLYAFSGIDIFNYGGMWLNLVGRSGDQYRIAGHDNADGVAFVSRTYLKPASGNSWGIYLVTDAGGSEKLYKYTKTFTATDLLVKDSAYSNEKKPYAVKIPFSSFVAQ